MRTLNEYFLTTNWDGFHNASDAQELVVPDAGVLRAVVIHAKNGSNQDTIVKVFINQVDSGIQMIYPITADEMPGHTLYLPTELQVNANDAITLKSGGQSTESGGASATVIIRR